MKKTILMAVSNQKGGVGKSALTVLLASYLYYVKMLDVAVIDCDTLQHSVFNMRKRDIQTVEKNEYYRQQIVSQWERIKKKSYSIVESSSEDARDAADEILTRLPELDLILVDLPGSVDSAGVFSTIVNMDYVLTPIVADRMVMQSTPSFSTALLDYLKNKEVPLRNFLFLWNKVDKRVSTEVFDIYNKIMEKLNLKVLDTIIPESKRFDKELSVTGNKSFFRSTLLPPSSKMLRGSNIDLLAEELCKLLGL